MIGYNEKQEALKLWSLLQSSQLMLKEFNASPAEIASACGVEDAADEEALQAARVRWYAWLALRVRAWRRSGEYALCFAYAQKAQRQPYDLLARLEVQDVEREAYEQIVPKLSRKEGGALSAGEAKALQGTTQKDEPTFEVDGFRVLRMVYLQGLTAQEDIGRARILYDRLLRILPMRELMERLSSLLKALESVAPLDENAKAKDVWLEKDVMSVLDKLVTDSFCRSIAPTQERASGAALNVDGNDFTILDRLMDNWDKSLSDDGEFTLPMDAVRRVGFMPSLLTAGIVRKVARANAAAAEAKQSSARQFVAIPGGHTMLGVYDNADRSAPEKFFEVVSKDQALKGKRLMRIKPYMGLQLMQLDDETEKLMSREGGADETFRAEDQGGRQVAEKLSCQVAEAKELESSECFKMLINGKPMDDEKLKVALRELREAVRDFFRLTEIPEKCKGPITTYGWTKISRYKAVSQLLAFGVGDSLLQMGCPAGETPHEVIVLLDELDTDQTRREEYAAFIRSLKDWSVHLYIRYYEQYLYREYRSIAYPESRYAMLKAWLERAAKAKKAGDMNKLAEPTFTARQLREYCWHGMKRFLYSGTSVQSFSLKPKKNVFEIDIFFQLACMWFRNQHLEDLEDLWFVGIENSPEESYFLVRNKKTRFVDILAETDEAAQSAGKLTPMLLRKLLVGANSDCVKLTKDHYSGRFRLE